MYNYLVLVNAIQFLTVGLSMRRQCLRDDCSGDTGIRWINRQLHFWILAGLVSAMRYCCIDLVHIIIVSLQARPPPLVLHLPSN